MSLEVLLIPIGIAAWGALREGRSSDLCERCKSTRVTDVAVLAEALSILQARVMAQSDDRLLASSRWGTLTFQKVGNHFLGRVDGVTEDMTDEMLQALDVAVGQVMQRKTAEQVVSRAEELGFRLVEQRDEAGSLNYVFEEV